MGLTDYLNRDQHRVRVETQISKQDPVLTEGINLEDPAFLQNYVFYVHVNAVGDGTHTMVATPLNTLRVLLDITIIQNNNAAEGVFATLKNGVQEVISEQVTAAGATHASNPLTSKYKPMVLVPETSLQLTDYANGVGDTTSFRVRYVDIKIRW